MHLPNCAKGFDLGGDCTSPERRATAGGFVKSPQAVAEHTACIDPWRLGRAIGRRVETEGGHAENWLAFGRLAAVLWGVNWLRPSRCAGRAAASGWRRRRRRRLVWHVWKGVTCWSAALSQSDVRGGPSWQTRRLMGPWRVPVVPLAVHARKNALPSVDGGEQSHLIVREAVDVAALMVLRRVVPYVWTKVQTVAYWTAGCCSFVVCRAAGCCSFAVSFDELVLRPLAEAAKRVQSIDGGRSVG